VVSESVYRYSVTIMVYACGFRKRSLILCYQYDVFLFQKAFIESLLDIYEQETEEMIDVIEESRMELRGDFMSFEDESKHLRAESRMLGTSK